MSAEVSILPARILREVSVTFTILRRIPFAHLRLRRQAPDATTPTPRFRGRIPRKTGHLCDVFSFSDAVLVCPAIGSGDNDDQSNFSRLHFLTNHTPPVPPVCVCVYPRQIGNGVLIGAGACLLGNISVGKGTQIGAGSLVVTDLPERCVSNGTRGDRARAGRAMERKLAVLIAELISLRLVNFRAQPGENTWIT